LNFFMHTSPSAQLDPTRRELARLLPADLPVDLDRVFPRLDGWGMKRSNRKRAELLAKAAPVLKAALAPDERVRYAATGIVSLWWEQLMAGWVSMLVNRTTLVLTTQRLLLIHTNSRGRPESYVNQIRLDGIRSVKRGWLGGALKLTLGRGTRTLTGIRRSDSRQLATMLTGRPSAAGGITGLCPACFAPGAGHGACPRCRTSVKSPRTAALRSLLLPGLGDFYLGHRFLASMEMVGSVVAWVVAVGLMLSALDPDSDQSPALAAVFAVVLLLVVNGFDAVLTYAQAKKGLHALDRHLPATPAAGHLVADRPRLGMSGVRSHRP
jgi:hypothetical protein